MGEPRELYDRIGHEYASTRRPDRRISEFIHRELYGCTRVVNVGAGTGAYEPESRLTIAVEPSMTMLRQRPAGAAPAVRARAERLPLRDDSVDAALAVLTIHHWSDPERGIAELKRVARRRIVLLTWDPKAPAFWLGDYFPEIFEIDRRIFPPLSALEGWMGRAKVRVLPIRADCCDGFLGAFWQRPEAYLDPSVRGSISTFSKLKDARSGLRRLGDDLRSGRWEEQYAWLREQSDCDVGYRVLVADG